MGLARIIKEKGLERLEYRLYDVLSNLVKRIDLETYGVFRAIMLTEGKELEEAVSGASREDQGAVQDLAKDFFAVLSALVIELMRRCSKITNQHLKRWMPYLEALSIYRQTSQALMYTRLFRVLF